MNQLSRFTKNMVVLVMVRFMLGFSLQGAMAAKNASVGIFSTEESSLVCVENHRTTRIETLFIGDLGFYGNETFSVLIIQRLEATPWRIVFD